MNKIRFIKFFATLISLMIFISLSIGCSKTEISKEKDQAIVSSVIKPEANKVYTSNFVLADTANFEKTKLLFVGASSNIYLYKMDTITGELTQISISPKTTNPSFLAIHPGKKLVYAVNETDQGKVSAFRFDTISNKIEFINSVSVKADGPCHISIDNTGKFVLVANYNSGSATVIPIIEDGALGEATSVDQHKGSGPVKGRQDGPHAHMILQAGNNFIYNTDLGIDKILIYRLDLQTGIIQSASNDASVESGAGPRHIAFHPKNPWAYVVCELGGIIEGFIIDNTTGALTPFQTISTLPDGETRLSNAADIHITPNGRFLYSSNRGNINTIAMYSINQVSGELTWLGQQSTKGNTPRNFAIDPSGKFLLAANQDGNSIVTFKIDPSSGKLIETGLKATVSKPSCLKFLEIYVKKMSTGIPKITK